MRAYGAAAAAISFMLAACDPNVLFGQTKEAFVSNGRTALRQVCASEAIQGLKTHLLADWTESQINEQIRAASDAAAASFQKMEWTHGVAQAEFNELMDAARTLGRLMLIDVSVATYPDSLSETVSKIVQSCAPQADDLMGGITSKLAF